MKDLGFITRLQPFIPQRCEIAPLVGAALIGGGASLLSSAFGLGSSAAAARRMEARLKEQKATDRAMWLNKRYVGYADTSAGQNLLRRAKQIGDAQWKRAEGAQAVAGGTAAATQMAKDSSNAMVAETMSNIAAQDTARKDRADELHQQAERGYMQQENAIDANHAAQVTKAAQAASNAIATGVSAFAQPSTPAMQSNDNNVRLQGSDNGGGNVQSQQEYEAEKLNSLYGMMGG
jgi:hypothetical protein